MSHAAISRSEIGAPSPGDWAAAAPEPSTRSAASTALGVDMLTLPARIDPPARDAVEVLVHETVMIFYRRLGLAPLGHEFGAQRLRIAAVVGSAAQQHGRSAVPAPRHAKARVRLGQHRLLQRRLAPAAAAVG